MLSASLSLSFMANEYFLPTGIFAAEFIKTLRYERAGMLSAIFRGANMRESFAVLLMNL